ncbi:oligosaccharide flippase family protein [Flavimarina sp. Hel_I_48]|uniref:oligosaccharide flippase family protein n=1 Tax=Flavimarina sp. Hel_I_48 TaxID=1392488 RepID=UPI0004DF2D28|nr:oligosaccharide flippase family protein [Flavimarina sp. Hel_I_48]
MSVLKRFVQDTAVYGLATVLPRVMSIILIGLHTDVLGNRSYADNTSFYVGATFLNVLLSFGMETAFFRFFSKSQNKQRVYSTVLIAITTVSLIAFVLLWFLKTPITTALLLPPQYYTYLLGITILDALVVAPFAYLRAQGKALRFAGIKIANLFVYVVLNFFFLWTIPKYNLQFEWFDPENLVRYIFIANLAASAVTILIILPDFLKTKLIFDRQIFKQLWDYGWPVLVAGLAFAINENLDKLLLGDLLDKNIMGAYAGCYKLAVFMTIFIQAFRLGAEPFFFNHASEKNAPQTYATILKYFVVVGAAGLLIIISFIDFFKVILIRNDSYYIAIGIVPAVLLANLFLGIYHNLSIWYKLTDKTRYGMYFSIVGAGITIVINIVFIPIVGFMAAAYATLVAYGSMMLISYFIGQKHYKIPYNLTRIGSYLIIAILFSGLSFYVFRENYLVSVILLAVFGALVLKLENKELKRILLKK